MLTASGPTPGYSVPWGVEYTDEFGDWWNSLDILLIGGRKTGDDRWYEKFVLLAAMDFAELRGARNLTQEDLAERLNISQSNVSRLEHRYDLLVSTLRQVVEAMGAN